MKTRSPRKHVNCRLREIWPHLCSPLMPLTACVPSPARVIRMCGKSILGATVFGTIQHWWWNLPTWGKWTTAICGIFALSSLGPAFHEGDPLAFIENFLALIFRYGTMFGSFAVAVWSGIRIAEHTGRSWLGWVVGICVIALSATVMGTFERLPGIGGRMKAMSNSDCYTDWDGRTNPTVCD